MRWWGWIALVVALVAAMPAGAAARREAVRLQGLALLAEPADGAAMVRALRAGEIVTVVGQNGNWVAVVLADGTKGHVYGGFLTGFPEIAPLAAYAGRMDPGVTRPVQDDAPAAPGGAEQAAAPKPVKSLVAKVHDPYAPVADGGGLDALLAVLLAPQAVAPQGQLPSSEAGDRKNRYFIEVHLSAHKLYLYENLPDGKRHLVRAYTVAVPGRDMEAPHGWGLVTGISFEPWWRPTPAMKERAKKQGKSLPESVKPGEKDNPMGPFKIILSHGYGFRIHGNNNPGSIGRSVTSGCIRMRNDEGKDMAKMIDVGTEVVFLE